MKALRRFFNRLAGSATCGSGEDRLKEEVEEHLALQTAENVRAALSPAAGPRRSVYGWRWAGIVATYLR